ncbi:Vegetative incompatibility protein HET-E-1 [Apiospora marii]|uniref:Vegetative incompatibility protein HET-E-1 n=1 Tax=Apiospora marii TaxID=335849 RepID=UPI00313002F4
MAGPLSAALGPTVHQSLEDAVVSFRTVLNDGQRQELRDMMKKPDVPDADSVLVLTARLDSINRKRRGKSPSTRLHSLLSSVGDFCNTITDGKPCNIADTYVSSHPEIAALVWGSIKMAMTIFMNFMSYHDATFNLLMKLTELCPLVSEYRSLYPDSTRLQRSLSAFYASIIRCCQHLVELIQRHGYMQFARQLTTSFDEEFRSDLDNIRSCRSSVKEDASFAKAQADLKHQQLQARERQEASHSREIMTRFFSTTERSLHKLGNRQVQSSHQESARRTQQLLDSLSTHDFMRPFKRSSEKRYGDTTNWVFGTEQFRNWLDGESPVLWCSGKSSHGCPVSFFFAQSDDTNSLSAHVILSSILHQRLKGIKVSKAMEGRIRTIISSSTSSDVLDLLRELMPAPLKSYILIDGLDECDAKDRKELLQTLSALVSSGSNIRLFLSSRFSLQKEVKKRFTAVERLTLDCEATNEDIATYIEGILDEKLEDGELTVGDPALVGDIKTALMKGAQGMFLWTEFQLKDVCRQHCDEDIRHILSNLPRDLAETFQRALRRIERQKHGAAARKVFPWVAASKRPLSLGELREAIAIEIGQQYNEPTRLYNDMEDIASWCENLIQLDEESQIVQFAHSAVRTFLLEKPSAHDQAGFHLLLGDVDHRIGEICVTYLNFNDFKTTLAVRSKPLVVDPSKVTRELFEPGSKRAALVSRIVSRPKAGAHDMQSTTAFSLQDSRSRTTALEAGHPFLNYASVNWILHTTSFRETTSKTWRLWEIMVTNGHGIAQTPWEGDFYDKAVWNWAIQARHYAMVHLLVTHNESSTFRSDILQDAAKEDDAQLIDALLKAPWTAKAYSQALQIASYWGHIEVVERLLAAKADVNAKPAEIDGRTALQAAAKGGHIEVVDRLKRAGAR